MNRTVIHKVDTRTWSLHHNATRELSRNLSVVEGQIEDLVVLLRGILSDENFITLLRAEGLITIPNRIADACAEEK
jgi:hypothetical protein